MTTTRQRALMLVAILGLSSVSGYEAMGFHLWNTLAFGFLAVACAAMFVAQVGEERRMLVAGFRYPWTWCVAERRLLLEAIRRSRNWTWKVKR